MATMYLVQLSAVDRRKVTLAGVNGDKKRTAGLTEWPRHPCRGLQGVQGRAEQTEG